MIVPLLDDPTSTRTTERGTSLWGRSRIPIVGGALDGATVEVPRRTPAGLQLILIDQGVDHHYELVSRDGFFQFVPAAPALGRLAWELQHEGR